MPLPGYIQKDILTPKNSISLWGLKVNQKASKMGNSSPFQLLDKDIKVKGDIHMAYVMKEYDLGRIRQIEKYYPGNYGAPGKPRGKKRNRTPEDIDRQNKTNREKKIQRLILANFKEGDWHLILSYIKDKRPGDAKEAKKQIQKFLADMRKEYKNNK